MKEIRRQRRNAREKKQLFFSHTTIAVLLPPLRLSSLFLTCRQIKTRGRMAYWAGICCALSSVCFDARGLLHRHRTHSLSQQTKKIESNNGRRFLIYTGFLSSFLLLLSVSVSNRNCYKYVSLFAPVKRQPPNRPFSPRCVPSIFISICVARQESKQNIFAAWHDSPWWCGPGHWTHFNSILFTLRNTFLRTHSEQSKQDSSIEKRSSSTTKKPDFYPW